MVINKREVSIKITFIFPFFSHFYINNFYMKQVSIFQECQPEFLHDLVLKMRAYIFTPGDLVCRKGEVAREMFIIADGILEVIK